MGGDWRSFVYGGLAAVTAEIGTFPIDTTKTRLQVQGQSGDKNLAHLKYKGMIDAFIKISKEEGFTALYSGIVPAALRQAIYGTIKYGTYYTLKGIITENEIFAKKADGRESVGSNILCAALAGAISSAIANPTDVLKVRLQVQGSSGNSNVFKLFNDIYQHEGIRGLWRGVGPTAQRAIVLTSVGLPLYDSVKDLLLGPLGDGVVNHGISSCISSLGGAICSCPIDVIRTRLMNQKIVKKSDSAGPRIYKGSIDCAIQTVKNEGFFALYKGFVPTLLRMGPWNIIFFISYEELKLMY